MPKEIMKLYVRIIMIIRNDKECLCEMNVCEALCVCVCVWEEADTSAFMCWMDTLASSVPYECLSKAATTGRNV